MDKAWRAARREREREKGGGGGGETLLISVNGLYIHSQFHFLRVKWEDGGTLSVHTMLIRA